MQNFKYMKLSGVKKQSVQLTTDTEGANIYINDLEVPYADFKGYLFAPITLEAKAPAGYTFTGWKQTSAATHELFGMNSSWKYYDKGAQSSTIWRTSSYNDTSWSSGESPLGYKTPGIKTTVGYGSNANQKNPTTYFRKTFTLSKTPSSKDVFILDYQVDDGFVVYVNGSEAGRVNMPSGTISYNTYSSTYAGDEPITGTLDLPARYFQNGTNLIAVEVHNNNATSSDLFWAASLNTTIGAVNEEFISTEAIIDLPSDNYVGLTACFSPLSEEERLQQGITPVRINEVSASNGIYVNEFFKHNDWIELYNTTDQPIDVDGMYLSDNLNKPQKYQISKTIASDPSIKINTIIPAHGYLIIWCDKLEPKSQLHASFKLEAEGGDILLTAADGSWSDHLVYTAMKSDETVGRYPDGSNNVYVMNIPTIAKTNVMSSYAVDVQEIITGISETMAEQRESNDRIFNLKGQAVQGTLTPGIYIKNGKKIIVK
jgi:hypothetical protein